MRPVTRLNRSRLAWLALALAVAVAAPLLLHETRGNTFWVDEWDWALHRRGGGLDTFLRPHNEHLSLIPVAVYKALFATAGLDDYAPYRVIGLAAHLAVVALLFAYARLRIGELAALLAAIVMLLLGPAWQNILWPFQVGSLISLAAGVAALLALDRGGRLGNASACVLLAVALASSGIGLPIVIGAAIELLWRRRAGGLWIVGVPLALYAVWWLAYQQTDFIRHNLVLTPGYAADSAAAALSALTGLAGPVNGDGSVTLGWGRPLLVVAVAAVAWRIARIVPVPARIPGLLAMLLSFWILTGLRRAQISTPFESRYLYVSGLLLLLLGAELARGLRWSGRVTAVACLLVAAVVAANVGDLRDGARYLRAQGPQERAVLGGLELTRPLAAPDAMLTRFPGYPFVVITARDYFAAAEADGSPALAPQELAAAPEDARLLADAQIADIHAVELRSGSSPTPSGSAPVVDAAAGGTVRERGACVLLAPHAARVEALASVDLTVPAGGLLLRTRGEPATVSLRRFAAGFPEAALGTVAGSATLQIGRDLARAPWHARIESDAAFEACGLSG